MKNPECIKCRFCLEDNNDTDVWTQCRNPDSKNYFSDINNVEECDDFKELPQRES